jgi:hypothetical protein
MTRKQRLDELEHARHRALTRRVQRLDVEALGDELDALYTAGRYGQASAILTYCTDAQLETLIAQLPDGGAALRAMSCDELDALSRR